MGCLADVSDTFFYSRFKLSPWAIACMVILIFWGGSFLARGAGCWHNRVANQVYLTAMLENNLIDIQNVKDLDALIPNLDNRGKRLLMMKMMQENKK